MINVFVTNVPRLAFTLLYQYTHFFILFFKLCWILFKWLANIHTSSNRI